MRLIDTAFLKNMIWYNHRASWRDTYFETVSYVKRELVQDWAKSFKRDFEDKREIVVNLNDVTESFMILIVSYDLELFRRSDFFNPFSNRRLTSLSERRVYSFTWKSDQWHISAVVNWRLRQRSTSRWNTIHRYRNQSFVRFFKR